MEVLSATELAARRKDRVKWLANIVKQPAPQFAEIPKFTPDRRFDHAYGRLAEGLFVGFYNQARSTGNEKYIELASRSNILSGLYTMTKIMSYGPAAYADHVAESGSAPSLDELVEIMGRSASVTKPFADVHQKTNTVLEMNFGLKQYAPINPSITPFVIGEDETGSAILEPSPIVMSAANVELLPRIICGEIPKSTRGEIHCPAVGMVMNRLWSAGVQSAATNPELFAADLEKAVA